MQFNSLIFILFAVVFFIGWPFMRRRNNVRWIYLVFASFIFYGWWDWRFLFLIAGSGFIDYFAGLAMEKYPGRRRTWLILSIIGNVGSLGIFKYLNFGITNANWILSLFGQEMQIPAANIILPVGISFYTFQSMSYTIDIYRGQLKPTHNVFHFFAYLALFPQLVAGPIVRARDLLPQLELPKPASEQQRWDGLNLIAFGFFKKVVIADTLAKAVNEAFGSRAPEVSCAYWWLIMVMFAFQIYCDFSGYSDIARGLGKWMGYEFPVNFRNPYIASSFREFWQRWHISLSTWFRDYVYISLGGSRKGRAWAHINMWMTMLISGLWHGAAWHFIVWATAHSFYLSAERVTKWPERVMKLPGGRHLCTLGVFVLTTIAWVFFRAQTFGQAAAILGIMFNFGAVNAGVIGELVDNNAVNVLLLIIGAQLIFYFGLDKAEWTRSKSLAKSLFDSAVVASIILLCVFQRSPSSTFIYFQF
jgi:D-alanyl-lipoteichoic acid acyltransferase DltB (MBOAT superfamily)